MQVSTCPGGIVHARPGEQRQIVGREQSDPGQWKTRRSGRVVDGLRL